MSSQGDHDAPVNRRTSRLRSNWTGREYGTVPRFDNSPDNWKRLETALGSNLKEINKAKIQNIVDQFLDQSTAAKSAPYACDVQAELDSIRSAAKDLKSRLARSDGNAAAEAQNRIRTSFRQWRSHDPDAIDKLSGILTDLMVCCAQEIDQSKSSAGAYNEFDEWDTLIVRLTNHFKDFNLPRGARFSGFIAELQHILPEGSTIRRVQSTQALEQAIKRARKAHQDKRTAALRADCPDRTNVSELEDANVPNGHEDE